MKNIKARVEVALQGDSKKFKGITLISLVITIIVILILAGVGIAGSLALIERAKYAAFINEMKQIDEAVLIRISEYTIDSLTDENAVLFETKFSVDDLYKLSANLKYEILYAREGMPEGKVPTKEFYAEEQFDSDVQEGYIKGIYYIDSETAGGKEKAYIYDEQSAAAYKVEPTIIWGVEMHRI